MQRLPVLLLNASTLLNLYATGRLREIALSLPYRIGVADYVLEQEALYVWRPSSGGSREEQVAVDVSFLVEEGLVAVPRLEHQEEEATFVDLAAQIDDGEAVTAALAMHRGWAVATDDRKARRILSQRAPSVPLVSTLELLKQWSENASIPATELRSAMRAMRSGASYVPGGRDPLYDWSRAVMEHDEPP